MKSITIHQLEEDLARELEKQADAQDLSLNRTIKKLLRQALGIDKEKKNSVDFSDLCGVWSRQEMAEFNKKTAALNRINPEDWP